MFRVSNSFHNYEELIHFVFINSKFNQVMKNLSGEEYLLQKIYFYYS